MKKDKFTKEQGTKPTIKDEEQDQRTTSRTKNTSKTKNRNKTHITSAKKEHIRFVLK